MTSIHLRAKDVMSAPVITVRPETTVKDIAALMLTHHISGLPVVTAEGELIGIVTEADLLYKETDRERDTGRFLKGFPPFGRMGDVEKKADGLVARDLMSAPVIAVEESTPLHKVAGVMVRRKINRVPVLRQGRLVGIVSRADVLRVFTRSDEEIAQAVHDALLHDLWVDVSKIHIDVRHGVVFLEGEVERQSERNLVTRWVESIDGVVAVESRLVAEYDDRAVSLGTRWPVDRV